MKRGWITWDKSEIPPSAFDARLAVVHQQLAARDLAALVVYTDVWRSNQGRYLANFMPYWNRALLVIPRESAPILLCGLSPRVYPWIRSVTILEEIRPSQNIAQQLTALCTEKGWAKIGVLDLPQLPSDLAIPNSVDVPWSAIHPEPDEFELSMYRRAARMARLVLAEELPSAAGRIDHDFVSVLEHRFRRAGVEDLVILTTSGKTPPLPPNGTPMRDESSVSVALEYRGHWVKIVRSLGEASSTVSKSRTELLSGPYPYEACEPSDLRPGCIFALTTETRAGGRRIFDGETLRQGLNGPELL